MSSSASSLLFRRLAPSHLNKANQLSFKNLLSNSLFKRIASCRTLATTASFGQTIEQLARDVPHKDAVRYEHKNVKWSFKHVEYFSDALAYGLLETGLAPGDALLSWLPSHFAEQHILQLACSKGGFLLYQLDPSVATTNIDAAKASLKNALEITEATCLFSQQAGDDVNYVRIVKEIIPEVKFFDIYEGKPFFTPRFPHLRFPIHTGLDIVASECRGIIPYKYFLVPVTGELDKLLNGAELSGSTPLLGELTTEKDGTVKKGKILTNDEVLMSKAWPEVCSMVNKEYIEVDGVGVIF